MTVYRLRFALLVFLVASFAVGVQGAKLIGPGTEPAVTVEDGVAKAIFGFAGLKGPVRKFTTICIEVLFKSPKEVDIVGGEPVEIKEVFTVTAGDVKPGSNLTVLTDGDFAMMTLGGVAQDRSPDDLELEIVGIVPCPDCGSTLLLGALGLAGLISVRRLKAG